MPALTLCSLSAHACRSEDRQLPRIGLLIVTDKIRVVVCASQFEVPMVRRQPRVDNIRDGDATLTQNERARRLLAAVAGVALDIDTKQALFRPPNS